MNMGTVQMINDNRKYYDQRTYAGNRANTSSDFNNSLENRVAGSVGKATTLTLHTNNDADDGEKFVGAWTSAQTGTSASVYKPDDFSEENPYYHVKIWKQDGTVEERMVDVLNYNPKSADSFEQYAFACYLDKEEGIPVVNYFLSETESSEADLYQPRDWVKAYKNRMQQQYDVGYHEGYMRYKKMYERLMEQFMKIGI